MSTRGDVLFEGKMRWWVLLAQAELQLSSPQENKGSCFGPLNLVFGSAVFFWFSSFSFFLSA